MGVNLVVGQMLIRIRILNNYRRLAEGHGINTGEGLGLRCCKPFSIVGLLPVLSGFIELLRFCVDRICNNNVRIAALFDCHIGNHEGLSGIGIGFVTRIKMHDLRTGGEINNIDDVFFGILLDGKRNGCLLTAVRNIAAVVLRDRRSTLMVKLVNIRTVCKRDQRTDFLTGHCG